MALQPALSSPARRGVPRWLPALVVFVLTLLGGAYITDQVLLKSYSATALIQVYSDRVAVNTVFFTRPEPVSDAALIEKIKGLSSSQVLLPVIQDLGLAKSWSRLEPGLQGKPMSPEMALQHLQEQVRFEVQRGTNIIQITVASSDPEQAADIANAIADHYMTLQAIEEDKRIDQGTAQLYAELAQRKKALDVAWANVQRLKALLPPGADDVILAEDKKVEGLKSRLLTAREDLEARYVLEKKISGLSDDDVFFTLNAMGRPLSGLDELRKESLKHEAELEEISKGGAGSQSPQVVTLQKTIKQSEEKFRTRIRIARLELKIDVQAAEAKVNGLQKEMDQAVPLRDQRLLEKGNPKIVAYLRAEHDFEVQQGQVEALDFRLTHSKTDKHILLSPVKIISRAEPPSKPSRPNKRLCYGLTFLVALTLSGVTFYFSGSRRRPLTRLLDFSRKAE